MICHLSLCCCSYTTAISLPLVLASNLQTHLPPNLAILPSLTVRLLSSSLLDTLFALSPNTALIVINHKYENNNL